MFSAVRARGILGTSAAFAIGLSGIASIVLIAGVEVGLVPATVYGIRELVAVAARAALAGAAIGALFAGVVAWRARGVRLDALRYRVLAGVGFLAAGAVGLSLNLISPGAVPVGVLLAGALGLGALGAGFGIATLALARRAAGLNAIPQHESAEGTLLPPVI